MAWRWPRSLLALLLASSAGAFGALALAVGSASAAPDAPPCGNLGQNPCQPTYKVTAQTTETEGTITIEWAPGAGTTPTVNPNTPTLTWVQQTNPPSGAPQPTFNDVQLTGGTCVTPPGSQVLTCTYPWPSDLVVGGYVLNGTYTLNAQAVNCLAVLCSGPTTVSQPVAVANPPAKPTGVTTALTQSSSGVTISWAPNPEPDIVGYVVKRSDGSVACSVPSVQPNPTTYSCVDRPTKDGPYSYRVVASRWGAVYDQHIDKQATTPGDLTKAVTVVGTSANTTTTVAGGTTGTLGPPGFTAKPSPSKISNGGGTGGGTFHATPGTAPPQAVVGSDTPANGDTGFAPTLPYGQQPTTTTVAGSDPAALAAPAAPHKGKTSVGTIAVVGAGLLLAVIALHGLWLRSEVRRTGTLEPLEPES